MSKYLVLCLIGLLVNMLIVMWLTSLLVPYLLAQVIATGLTLIINFLSNNFWTFRRSTAKVTRSIVSGSRSGPVEGLDHIANRRNTLSSSR